MNRHDGLDLSRVNEALHGAAIGHTIDYHQTIDSTMPRAMALAKEPATTSGTVVFTEVQQAGRGRRGRTWSAPYASSLLLSVILKGPILPNTAAQLSMIAGIAAVDAIKRVCPPLHVRVGLKWPNDVVVLDDTMNVADAEAESGQPPSFKKIGGILAQVDYRGETPEAAVVGIGLNVNQTEERLPTVVAPMITPGSLRIAADETVDREALFIQLCRALERVLDSSHAGASVVDEYRKRLCTLGQRVDVYSSPEDSIPVIQGIAEDISELGDLLVRDELGTLHTVSAGDVSIRHSEKN